MSINLTKGHIPVLTEQVIQGLSVQPGGTYIDCTVGAGGHAYAVLQASCPDGRLLGMDMDASALKIAASTLEGFGKRVALVNANFNELGIVARNQTFLSVNGVLLDLGLSSMQLEGQGRGFSFNSEDFLDMRFDVRQELTAWDIVNKYTIPDLAHVINSYGEEPFGDRIASEIVKKRPIETTKELSEVVSSAVRRPRGRINPATRTFQAIRIEVNNELQNLRCVLNEVIYLLTKGGRLAIISYHSLEDRIVKNFFKYESRETGTLNLINKKIISPSRDEVLSNRRSRSARMRVAERI